MLRMISIFKHLDIILYKYFELAFWIFAMIALAFMSPTNDHSTLCPLSNLGIGFCPGCGLGHSISWLFHGNIKESFNAHPIGWIAVIIVSYRTYTLLRNLFTRNRIA